MEHGYPPKNRSAGSGKKNFRSVQLQWISSHQATARTVVARSRSEFKERILPVREASENVLIKRVEIEIMEESVSQLMG